MIGGAQPCYFGPEGDRLFGWYHSATEVRGPGVVICPPLFHEMIASHRSLRHLGEAGAAAGMPTLRFDYHGSGDSAGSDLDPQRIAAWIGSIDAACDALRGASGVASLVLVGVRLGALLACRAALHRKDIAGLVLWAPLASGRSFLRETGALARLTARDDMLAGLPEGAASASGFVLTPETVGDLGTLDIACIERRPARQVLIVPHEDVPGAEKTARALVSCGAEVEVRELPGLSAMLRLPHEATVPGQVIDATVAWARAQECLEGSPPDTTAAPVRPMRLLRNDTPAGASSMHLPGQLEERPFVVGERLFGILTLPPTTTAPPRPAIVLANAGAAYRIGVNRLYVTFARAWASLGFPVLRLDLGGLGDSLPAPGVAENEPYSAAAVDDLDQAAAALRAEVGVGAVVVGGICSGAHAAFHAARQLPGITGVLMLNPVVFYWRPGDSLTLADWRTYSELRDYGRRLARLETWRRLWRGEIRAGESVRALGSRVAQAVRSLTHAGTRGDEASGDAGRDLLRMCEDGKDVLLLFSDGEPGLDYLRYNHARDLRRLARCPGFRLEVIGTPGHDYPSVRAQRDVLERATGHLLQHYGAA